MLRKMVYVRSILDILDGLGFQQESATKLYIYNNCPLMMSNAQQQRRTLHMMDIEIFRVQDTHNH